MILLSNYCEYLKKAYVTIKHFRGGYLEKQFYIIERCFDLLKLTIKCIALYFTTDLIMNGIIEISEKSPGQILALSDFIEKLKLSDIIPWIISAVTSTGYMYERSGKKRAIKKVSRLQKEVEKNDPNRTSSGLTETGETPEDD